MKKIFLLLVAVTSVHSFAQKEKNSDPPKANPAMDKNSIYQFKVEDLSGKTFDFASLQGKKVIIVNTASKCGLTPQYEDLEMIYKKFEKQGLVIVGFPANDFAEQEPGTNIEIATFCKQNYGVTFPMMSKISVKGDQMAPIYKFLTQKSQNLYKDSEVQWNFQKFFIGKNGHLEQVVDPRTRLTPGDVGKWIRS
ncbi:glutathione peroxidase [Flavobacterium silvaticum]|uniref:Glutathione peroxidase n=1 Tax=Flavobacterium silvaticum TaxID=1852020 RepID=A0A972FNG2_9FLAO|nr:glutathione peroxidase [Flavobacterium silvaticum]NMH28938.1 glutathione peroxidase [Flavobacterium silvaticum]